MKTAPYLRTASARAISTISSGVEGSKSPKTKHNKMHDSNANKVSQATERNRGTQNEKETNETKRT
jgi:hypothetical protein